MDRSRTSLRTIDLHDNFLNSTCKCTTVFKINETTRVFHKLFEWSSLTFLEKFFKTSNRKSERKKWEYVWNNRQIYVNTAHVKSLLKWNLGVKLTHLNSWVYEILWKIKNLWIFQKISRYQTNLIRGYKHFIFDWWTWSLYKIYIKLYMKKNPEE